MTTPTKPTKNAIEIGNKNGKTIWDTSTLKNIKSIVVTNQQGQVVDSIDLTKYEQIPNRFIPER